MIELHLHKLNGSTTNPFVHKSRLVKLYSVYSMTASNYWSSTENSTNNAWNLNFSSGNLNNNNNKYNSNNLRAVAALSDEEKQSWLQAYDDCCKNKKTSRQCTIYRIHYEEDLFKLAYEVKSRTYQPSTSVCFCVSRPKVREVFAADFRDRIVQHWIVMKLNPLIERRFVEQGNLSYNCRKGFGVLAAQRQLYKDMRKTSKNFTKPMWVGHFDLISFFPSINVNLLWDFLEDFIKEVYKGDDIDDVSYITEVVVKHRPQFNCRKTGNLGLFKVLPHDKSLFYAEKDKGMPIGNVTSQIFANFFLSSFDEFLHDLIRSLGGEYKRFVDDFYIIAPSPKIINHCFAEAIEYLKTLDLKMHLDKVYIQPIWHGMTHVGSVVKPFRTYIINRTVGNMDNVLFYMEILCSKLEENITYDNLFTLRHYVSSVNSYFGFTRYKREYQTRYRELMKHKGIFKCMYIKKHLSVIKPKEKYNILNYLDYDTEY